MQRETSAEAYQSLFNSGFLKKCQLDLLEFVTLAQDEPNYCGMVARCDAELHFSGDPDQTYGPRFAELEYKGLLYRAGYKLSCRSNHRVQGWRTTASYDDIQVQKKKFENAKMVRISTAYLRMIEAVKAVRDEEPTDSPLYAKLKVIIDDAVTRRQNK